MQVVNNKIVAASREELFDYYLKRGLDSVYPFNQYLGLMIEAGVDITCGNKKIGTMTRNDLIAEVAAVTGIARSDVENVIVSALLRITVSLERHRKVTLRGFGTFAIRKHASKVGRNISTDEQVEIPPRSVVKFIPSRDMREGVDY